MDIRIFQNAEALGEAAAQLIADKIKSNPKSVLGLATGATPLPTYRRLIEKYQNGEISFQNTVTFNLDEYCAIPRSDKNSYYTFMQENLFSHIDIKKENIHVPDGNPVDLAAYCASYDGAIKAAGGIDIQLLGIGGNGHIGFNEPSNEFTQGTYKVTLTKKTLEANKIYFPDEESMPKEAITMGIQTILSAKEILLLATGASKAQAVAAMIKGTVTPSCPASVLQRHNHVHIFLDEAAAALL